MRGLLGTLAVLLLLGAAPPVAAEGPAAAVTVGVLFDGPVPDDDPVGTERRAVLLGAVERETVELLRRDRPVRFPEDKRRTADYTLVGVRAAIDRLLGDPEVDVVVSLGPLTTHELARREALPKPVIGAWAVDIGAQRLPFERDATGVRNLNYIVSRGSALDDLAKLRELVDVTTVHVLVDQSFSQALPELAREITVSAGATGLRLVLVTARSSAAEALGRIPADAEAVYVTPMLEMSGVEFDRLVAGLIERRLPSFSLIGEDEVERGILAGLRATTDLPRLARRIALNTQRVVEGEDAGTLPVLLDQHQRLMINMETARAIGVHPRWRLLIEAIQLHPDSVEAGAPLGFDSAVLEAVDANLALAAAEREVAAAAQDVRRARASYRPQADALLRGLRIDEDRAAASLGTQAERTLTGAVSLEQLVYSDAARAGVEVSRDLQAARERDLESLRLDTALDAAVAYLDVLRAETLQRVSRENLRLTESNLDLATRREELGAAGPGDVYRWRAELANDRSALIAARNRTAEAKVLVNRLRNRPLEEPFVTSAPGMDDPGLIVCCDRLAPFIDNPAAFARFREYAVRDGLARSVELAAIDATIDAAERRRVAARRDFWAPDVALRADLERDVSRDGAGSAGPSLPGVAIEGPDRDSWSAALQATLPLWRGGARDAELRQSTDELATLRLRRAALAEGVEARIRLAMLECGTTYPAIELAREAAEAATQNLDLVTDAYSQGVVSIISLLDAQNAALAANEAAANAVYEFLSDLMELERATNRFDFFRSAEDRELWLEGLRRYFDEGS